MGLRVNFSYLTKWWSWSVEGLLSTGPVKRGLPRQVILNNNTVVTGLWKCQIILAAPWTLIIGRLSLKTALNTLYHTALYYIEMHHTLLHYTTLYFIALHCTIHQSTALQHSTPHYTALRRWDNTCAGTSGTCSHTVSSPSDYCTALKY